MNFLIVAVAQYLAFVVVAAAAVVWLLLPRLEKIALAGQAVVALVLVLLLILLAAAVHTDPRPFVVNPSVRPLFPHPADNGFPSDHTALSMAVALLVAMYRRWIGAALVVCSVLIGAARVAAHVHHTQDIVAGAVIGVIAVAVAALLWQLVWRVAGPRVPARLLTPGRFPAPDRGVEPARSEQTGRD